MKWPLIFFLAVTGTVKYVIQAVHRSEKVLANELWFTKVDRWAALLDSFYQFLTWYELRTDLICERNEEDVISANYPASISSLVSEMDDKKLGWMTLCFECCFINVAITDFIPLKRLSNWKQ